MMFFFSFQPSSPVDEIVDKLQEAIVSAEKVVDDPAILKQKLMAQQEAESNTPVQETAAN